MRTIPPNFPMPGATNHQEHRKEMSHRLENYPFPGAVLDICRSLGQHGHSCFLVGGCLRDILLGEEPGDFDLATDATPAQVMAQFQKTIPTGVQFGTVTVLMKGVPYEVTTFRGDGAYHDGRRPEVVSFRKDIRDDLARRDFTFNAMAYDPLEGRLVDEFGGLEDLQEQRVRSVGLAQDRLLEDGLRIMRAFRFMRFGKLDPELEGAIRKHKAILKKISKERVRVELVKLMSYPDPAPILKAMGEAGLFDIIYRPLGSLQSRPELWDPLLAAVSRLGGEKHTVKFASLFALVGFEKKFLEKGFPNFGKFDQGILESQLQRSSHQTLDLLKKETYSRKEQETVAGIIQRLWVPYHHLGEIEQRPGYMRWAKLQHLDWLEPVFRSALALEEALGRKEQVAVLRELKEKFDQTNVEAHLKPVVDGRTIMEELGIRSGRMVGELKDGLYWLQVANDITDKSVLLGFLKRMVKDKNDGETRS